MRSDRLSSTQAFETLKLAAGAVLLSPYVPLLFMGEEYGETLPFHYFVRHSDSSLIEAVRKGRDAAFGRGQGESPPTRRRKPPFVASKIDHGRRKSD